MELLGVIGLVLGVAVLAFFVVILLADPERP
jgi:predicted PurR-regulated permease PerM